MSILDRSEGRWGMGRVGGRRGGPRRRPRGVLGLEVLEVRVVLSTSTWSGLDASTNANWSDANNWVGTTIPSAGNDLVFPSEAPGLTNNDDLGADIAFGSLTIGGNGYAITGDSASFTSIDDASQASGTSTVSLPIALTGAGTVSVDTSGTELVLGGVISGSVGLAKNGVGTLDLTASNTYTGTTTINTGTLLVDGSQGGSAVTAASGTTLGGVGTVGSITTSGATVTPGDNGLAGILIDAGALNLGQDASSNNSTYSVVIDGSTAGNGAGDYSQTQVAGSVAFNGATLHVALGPDFTPSVPTSFTIIDNTGTSPNTGTFSGLGQGTTMTVPFGSSTVTFAISYNGGANGNSVVLTEVDPSTTVVTFAPSSPVFGQSVALTATVAPVSPATGTPTGTVEFMNGTTLLDTATLSGGVATYNTTATALATGSNSITAIYSGDDTFATSTSTAVTVSVAQADSSTVVTYFPSSPVSGQNVTLTATVSAASPGSGTPTGTVQFFNGTTSLGTTNLTNGVATLPPISSLSAGANTISAQYEGDVNFRASTSPNVTVNLATTATATTTVTFSPSSPVYGGDVTLTATVAPITPLTATPTGTVVFYNGTTSLGSAALTNGVATLAPTALPSGANSITAQYSGDTNFTSSTSPVATVTVGLATTTTAVTFSPAAPVFGQSVTLTATITPTSMGSVLPTGTVTFFNGSTSLGPGTVTAGVATLDLNTFPVGDNSITAQYGGDTNYAASTSPAVTVPVAQSPSATTVTTFPASPVAGQNVTLTATVTATSPGAGTPTGTVQFYNGSTALGSPTTLAGGVATLRTTALSTGDNSITAVYSGDTNFVGSTSPAVTVTVAATATSTTTVTFAPSAPVYGNTVTLTATVAPVSPLTGTPTGTVDFYNGTTLLGTGTLTGGVATFSTSTLPVTSNSITAQYSGDSALTSSTSAPVTLTVTQVSTTTALTFTPTSPGYGTSVTFTATITPATTGTAVPSGTMSFYNGSTLLGTGTVANNVATFTTSALPVGNNSITATYSGDTNYAGSTSTPATVVTVTQQTTTTTVTFSPTLPVFGQVITLTATIAPSSTGAASPTGTVDFFNGATLIGTGTVSNDVATLNTTALAVSNTAVTAQYLGDANYAGSTSAVNSFAVVLAATTTTLSVSSSNPAAFASVTLTAVVGVTSPGAGTAAGTVEFFVDGTSVGTATLSAGQASLAVVLPTAVNSVTAQYLGSSDLQSSASTAVTISVGTPNEQWLSQVYLVELGRAPTRAELTKGASQLAGGVSRKKIVNGIANSPEATAYMVQSDYQKYLGVQPTTKQVHITLKEAQHTRTSVLAVILGSQLFFEQSGGSLEGYLASLETAVLGTTTAEPALQFQLQQGVSRTKVANELLVSNLGKLSLVPPSFVSVLNRAPTRAELGNYVSLMSRGKFLRQIIASLLAGNEFYQQSTT